MTSRQAKIQENTHFRIMRILQENTDLTQRELAEKLSMSVGVDGLNVLIDNLLVKMQNFSKSKNKFGYVHLAQETVLGRPAIKKCLPMQQCDVPANAPGSSTLKARGCIDHRASNRKRAEFFHKYKECATS